MDILRHRNWTVWGFAIGIAVVVVLGALYYLSGDGTGTRSPAANPPVSSTPAD